MVRDAPDQSFDQAISVLDSAGTTAYAALGVHCRDTSEEIKKAYRRISRELHPDTNPDPEAQERLKLMSRILYYLITENAMMNIV